MKSKYDRRNYIIIGLCAILVVMGVGYAAFSSLLTINGTANISNSWCLGFDNTKTNTYQITKGVSTGQAPTGTMTYTGTACSTTLVPHSNLTAAFHQPGDQIEYTLTIKNASTVTAAIKSIKVDNQTITGNTTKTKGNITFTVNFPLDTTLSPNEETTMTVIAKFQNETDVTGSYAGNESQSISVELNGEQDDGNGGIVPTPSTFTGTIYRWSTTRLAKKGSSAASTYPYTITNLTKGTDYITGDDYPTYSARATALGKQYYLKHDIVNDEIINSYVCFVYNNAEHCMKGGDGGASFEDNDEMIEDYQSFYNLPHNNTWTDTYGCYFNSSTSDCYGGAFYNVYADDDGAVSVRGSRNEYCDVVDSGYSVC